MAILKWLNYIKLRKKEALSNGDAFAVNLISGGFGTSLSVHWEVNGRQNIDFSQKALFLNFLSVCLRSGP